MKKHIKKSPSKCLWLIFKLIFMYFFFVPWFKISKKLLVEKVFLKEKPGFKLFLTIAMKNGYVWYLVY